MGNPVFDWFIRRENFQLLLIAFGLAWFIVFAVYHFRLAQIDKSSTPNYFWLLIGSIGPLALVLWFVYNAIMDALGLDSVLGLVINLVIFLIIGLCFAFLLRMTPPPKMPAEEEPPDTPE